MQLTLARTCGDLEIRVGVQATRLWASYTSPYPAEPLTPPAFQRLLRDIRDLGYHVRRFETEHLELSTTQSYQVSVHIRTGTGLEQLASLSFDALRMVLRQTYTLYAKLAPVARTFAQLSEQYAAGDQETRQSIQHALRHLTK